MSAEFGRACDASIFNCSLRVFHVYTRSCIPETRPEDSAAECEALSAGDCLFLGDFVDFGLESLPVVAYVM